MEYADYFRNLIEAAIRLLNLISEQKDLSTSAKNDASNFRKSLTITKNT